MKFGMWVWVLILGGIFTYFISKTHVGYTTVAAILTAVLTFLAYRKM